jgi:hypothetical protein
VDLDRFEEAARRAFAVLEHDFSCEFLPDRERHWSARYLTYRNETTWVEVYLDDRDRAFVVLFGPLVDGEIPEHPIFLPPPDHPLQRFPLWAVMEARADEPPPFTFTEGDRLDSELRAWAEALRKHAGPALRGSFAGLEGTYEVVRANLEEAERRDDQIGRR